MSMMIIFHGSLPKKLKKSKESDDDMAEDCILSYLITI